jgi:hypothetical protein
MTLPKLNPNTPTLMDGEVRLFKRKRSSVWQVVFMMGGRQVRVSTNKRILKDAKDAAREIYLYYRVRQKNGLPVIFKRFASIAALCRATMAEQLENGVGKKSFRELGKSLFSELQLISGDLHACLLTHEVHEYPNALLRINCIHRCNEISKRSAEHFHAVSFAKTFGRESCTRCIASEHQT